MNFLSEIAFIEQINLPTPLTRISVSLGNTLGGKKSQLIFRKKREGTKNKY